MAKWYLNHRANLGLFIVFVLCASVIKYCYPVAQLTWDSYSYIHAGMKLIPDLRPLGYSLLLKILYSISSGISFIVYFQLLLHFLSVIALLKLVKRYFQLSDLSYFLLGVLLISEPVALYHTNSLLSDILFSSLSIFYLLTLILFIKERKTIFMLVHVLILIACIEVRNIALFYPFFSLLVLLFSTGTLQHKVTYGLLIIIPFQLVYKWETGRNIQYHQAPIFSAFSGWTQANNSLYVLRRIHIDPKFIEDPELRQAHVFFSAWTDTSSYIPYKAGPEFLWDARSPLCIWRKNAEDSLGLDFTKAWYHVAPVFAKYGNFIQFNFPYEYFMSFIVPNFKSVLTPYNGEMADYYICQDKDEFCLERYHLKGTDLTCKVQLYKDHVNRFNLYYYQLRLQLFLLVLVFLLFAKKNTTFGQFPVLWIMAGFVLANYLLTLYSSEIMPRYLIPVYPIMTVFIFVSLLNRKKMIG